MRAMRACLCASREHTIKKKMRAMRVSTIFTTLTLICASREHAIKKSHRWVFLQGGKTEDEA